jgi:hypothetical protein
VDLEEYYDEYGDFGFRPNRDLIEHPNGRGKKGVEESRRSHYSFIN